MCSVQLLTDKYTNHKIETAFLDVLFANQIKAD